MLTDELIVNLLKKVGLFGENNCYFSATILPTVKDVALLGNFATMARDYSGYIINDTENGIGIIPFNNMTGKPIEEECLLLPKGEINKIRFESGGLFCYKKIIIETVHHGNITFSVTKNVLSQKNHKKNVEYFIKKYDNGYF